MTLQVKAIVALLLLALVAVACGLAYKAGRSDGARLERAAWSEREAKELAIANGKIIDLTTKARAAEQKGAENVAAIGSKLEKERRDHAKTAAARDTALRSGDERVSIPVAGCQDPGRSAGAETAAVAGQSPTARAELRPATAADLVGLAEDANAAARDLNACLAVVAEDRRIVNGASP